MMRARLNVFAKNAPDIVERIIAYLQLAGPRQNNKQIARETHVPYSDLSIILDRMELAGELIRCGGTGSGRRLYGCRNDREREDAVALIDREEIEEKFKKVCNKRPKMKIERTGRYCLKCFRAFVADTRFIRLCPGCRNYASDNQWLDA